MKLNEIICAFGALVTSVHSVKILEESADDEIFKMSRMHQENIHHLYKRTSAELRKELNTHGKTLNSYLNPTSAILAGVNTPVWLAFTGPNGEVHYRRMRKNIVGIAAAHFSSSADYRSVGRRLADSFSSFEEKSRKSRERRNKKTSPNLSTIKHHDSIESKLTFKNEERTNLPFEKFDKTVREISRLFNNTDGTREKRSKKDVVYPSLLITTAYAGAKQSQNDLDYLDEIVYQLAFWNAVDLRCRHIKHPEVRLRIAGIIIGQNEAATPYLYNKDTKIKDGIELTATLSSMKAYWNEKMIVHPEFPLEAYHAVITMTDSKMYSRNYDQSLASGALGENISSEDIQAFRQKEKYSFYDFFLMESVYPEGEGYQLSLCYWHTEFDAIAVIHDNGGFDGHFTAVHELSTVMGLSPSHEGGKHPCHHFNGFVLEDGGLYWAECGLQQISDFLTVFNCADKPAEFHPPGMPVERFLPGEIMDDHTQCKARGHDWACQITPKICKSLRCRDFGFIAFWQGRWFCNNIMPAAEGTACGLESKCFDGECHCVSDRCLKGAKENLG